MVRTANRQAHGANGAGFEQSFQRLQQVVQTLSEGNLTLQEALSAFEEGMELADNCSRMLEEAELRVKQVSERALREGADTLADAGLAATGEQEPEAEGLVSIEIESVESAILFDTTPRVPEGRGMQRPGSRRVGRQENGRAERLPEQELDPLFDEEE